MLVLTRYIGQSVIINKNITATILHIKGNQVRLGIEAPKDIPVNRQEIHERIKAGKKKGEK